MNQKAFLQRFDALAFGALRNAGVADAASYTAKGGIQSVPCTVMLDEGVQQFGDDDLAPVATLSSRIRLQLAEVKPGGGAVVRIIATGKQWVLVKKLAGDASSELWEVAGA
ncbi:head-tail joining protein [Stenotrophomonas nitritireducens]|uniref:Uncharacterized protein n=1 Tax=Stenotrophomonas nitritireducens TaxID=83617 RepID=A0ABR5NFR3_9GAMM|nr:hypothetical protein [Stenotrophomonas nitritireducens]KRG54108.1 hypothetical protein ABB22_16985 [Stenotrophomonas nitritireducens]